MRLITVAWAMLMAAALAGCNSGGLGILKSSQTEQPLEAGAREAVLVEGQAPKARRLSGKGSGIVAVVNNKPITSAAIRSRAAFVRLRRLKGNARSVAREELIEEAIKMAEARRLGVVANEAAVEKAYASFLDRQYQGQRKAYSGSVADRQRRYNKAKAEARRRYNAAVAKYKAQTGRNPPPPHNVFRFPKLPKAPPPPSRATAKREIEKSIRKSGFSPKGFREFMRAQISWQNAVALRVRSQGRQVAAGGSAGAHRFQPWLAPRDAEVTTVNEYTVQQVIFVVPKGKQGQASARRASALRFRGQVDGCEGTKLQATRLRDVSVVDRGRVRANRLPPEWRSKIVKTPSGRATELVRTGRGWEMMVVCRTRQVRDVASEVDNAFAGGNLQKAASALDKKYYAELKEKAVIERR